ncbi:MAG: lipid asymmetry maintenance protein MlaB, partial [Candidatus Limnocylindrales bacterium]
MSRRPQDHFHAAVTTEHGRSKVVVSGVIDEQANLTALQRAEANHIEIDLGAVRRINSYGVRLWMNAMRELQVPGVRVTFINCPAHIIDQVNMVHGFLGNAHVASFLAPRLCDDCDERADQLVDMGELRAAQGALPDLPCPRCSKPMELDDVDHKYRLLLEL